MNKQTTLDRAYRAPFFAVTPTYVHASIDRYRRESSVAKTATFVNGKYRYSPDNGRTTIQCGGLLRTIKKLFHAHYKERTRRRRKEVQIRGSTAAKGKQTDREVTYYTMRMQMSSPCQYTRALIRHWEQMRHSPQAAQLPVSIPEWRIMTQADFISLAPDGKLWLWEVKTGIPVGAARRQSYMRGLPVQVPCTKYNIWQLQLHYTRKALERAGIQIAESRIIQVYQVRPREYVVKIHEPASWLAHLPTFQDVLKK